MHPQPTPVTNPTPPLPTTPEALLSHLDDLHIPYTLHHHAPVFTVEESAFLHATIAGAHCKNLFLRDKKGKMCLLTLADNTRPDLNKLSASTGFGRFSFGSAERLMQYLGVTPGSVCPYAIMNDTQNEVVFYLDKSLADSDLIIAHPLLNSMSISVKPADLIRFATHHNHPPHIIDLGPLLA